MPSENQSLFELVFASEAVDPGGARITGLQVHEGISRPYEVTAELDVPLDDTDPRDWLLRPAQVAVVRQPEGAVVRRYAGLITAVREGVSRGARAGLRSITVTLEPLVALLRYSTNRRIFQQKTAQQIAVTVLDEVGLGGSRVAWRLSASYPAREVCMQFDEPSFDFLSRVIEEDGIFYFFEHGDDGELLVFADSGSAFPEASPAELPFRPERGLVSEQAITELVQRDRVRPVKVTLRDHDFKRPALDLEAVASGEGPLGRELYDYPGRYVDPAEGRRRAQLRLDALKADATWVRASGTAFSLAPGQTFSITGAPDPALDRGWVVIEAFVGWTTEGGRVDWSNDLRLLPDDASFRPPRRAPRAVAPGPQVATVTGPPGEEIHCDEFGRVKVHFPWDRESKSDDKSSCWVRVGQMHTSGSVAIPRVGWEVIVDFEDGDPDRPIVLGRVYNPSSPPPYPLPGKKTMTALKSMSSPGSGGYNEIRMDDAAGGEHVQVYAQKDQNVNVANNRTEKVTNAASVSVGANHALTVGANDTVSVGAQYVLDVGAAQRWSVGGARTKTVGANEDIAVKGSRSMTIGASHTTMTPMSVGITTPASLTETVGGSCIEAAALEVGTMAAGSVSVTVGGAKVEAAALGKSDLTVGARASTVGGAFITASAADVTVGVGGAKATTVGGAWAANAGGDVQLTAEGNLSLNVGGAVLMNGASVVLKVGGSSVTVATGGVVIKSREIKLTATGPQPELAPMVADK
ncbi:type VI secretion system Vgr family protein [Sorangium sp. So ce854]|uniref:type VI secretion system Vgr family protein n=1 Tax=Sorangium sp. So ce854 TaxID=3133322 RepID=UPI003F615DD1